MAFFSARRRLDGAVRCLDGAFTVELPQKEQ